MYYSILYARFTMLFSFYWSKLSEVRVSDLKNSFARSVFSYFPVGMPEERHHLRLASLAALTLLSRRKADKNTFIFSVFIKHIFSLCFILDTFFTKTHFLHILSIHLVPVCRSLLNVTSGYFSQWSITNLGFIYKPLC